MTDRSPRAIRSRRVVTPDGVRRATVHIEHGRITRIGNWDADADAAGPPGSHASPDDLHDVGDHVVMAGLVDTHVHVNEPGRTEWEGFRSATRAAAAGGVTTLLDMPLNSIPATTNVAALAAKRAAASGQLFVDVGLIGGVVPGNAGELRALRDAGVLAFKCFLTPSGVDEFEFVSEDDLRIAFPVLAQLGTTLMVHAEDPALLEPPAEGDGRDYARYLATRPAAAERSAIEMLVRLVEWCPTRVHVVHLSSAEGLDVVRRAHARGLPISAETCPHYLVFSAEDIGSGATPFKCAPPIRDAAQRDALWEGLRRGDVGMIVSDHSPAPPEMKDRDGDFIASWGGIASLQLGLSAVWTSARARGFAIEDVARWMCEAPAALAGLGRRKGRLVQGADADIVVWNPDTSFFVDAKHLEHRHKVTPYHGRRLDGVVTETYLRGSLIFDRGTIALPRGELLTAS